MIGTFHCHVSFGWGEFCIKHWRYCAFMAFFFGGEVWEFPYIRLVRSEGWLLGIPFFHTPSMGCFPSGSGSLEVQIYNFLPKDWRVKLWNLGGVKHWNLRWRWQLQDILGIFTPKIYLGEEDEPIFDGSHLLQRGCNHQLVTFWGWYLASTLLEEAWGQVGDIL